jgi:RimJ/RimL family protein N-acetyltransferase
MPHDVQLREVLESDLPVFFDHQRDPEANRQANFPPRDWDAFMAHWANVLRDDDNLNKTILFNGRVAGNVGSYVRDGHREVGYWLGRDFWGQGIASRALAAFLADEKTRPLFAGVAQHNRASVRVLEKCGFSVVGVEPPADGGQTAYIILKLPPIDQRA